MAAEEDRMTLVLEALNELSDDTPGAMFAAQSDDEIAGEIEDNYETEDFFGSFEELRETVAQARLLAATMTVRLIRQLADDDEVSVEGLDNGRPATVV